MTNPNLQRSLNLGLATLCLLGTLLIVFELGKWPFLGSPPGTPGKAATKTSPKKMPVKAKKAGNPFARTPQASALPVTSQETGITVYGVIIGPKGSVVLAKAGSGRIKQYKPGQSLSGFQIKEVRSDRLVLQKGDNGPTKTIRWLKRQDYLNQPRSRPALPPSQAQITRVEDGNPRKDAPQPRSRKQDRWKKGSKPRGFQIKPGPQQKLDEGKQ
jgi:hypothetical protein